MLRNWLFVICSLVCMNSVCMMRKNAIPFLKKQKKKQNTERELSFEYIGPIDKLYGAVNLICFWLFLHSIRCQQWAHVEYIAERWQYDVYKKNGCCCRRRRRLVYFIQCFTRIESNGIESNQIESARARLGGDAIDLIAFNCSLYAQWLLTKHLLNRAVADSFKFCTLFLFFSIWFCFCFTSFALNFYLG